MEMAMTTNGQSIEKASLGVIDKTPKLRKAIVKISQKEKLNAETVDKKDKSGYFEVVKQEPQNLPDPKNKTDGKGSYPAKIGKHHQKGKLR